MAGLALTALTFPAGTFTHFIAGGKIGTGSELGLRQELAQATTAAVLIYRLLSFWIPMIPGGSSLHLINRRPTRGLPHTWPRCLP
jgi:hypothetical protein